jgi:hypothetical protein
MNALWSYFWPLFGLGLLAGAIAGLIGFRLPRRPKDAKPNPKLPGELRRKRVLSLATGIAVSLIGAGLWHGPFGGADRFSAHVERNARLALNHYEMMQVSAHLHHGPLTRRLILSGPADAFQHDELARLLSQLPGVSRATWEAAGGGVPLIAEGAGVALLGFLIGLLLAYLVELRRRYNAQWNW